MQCAKIAFFWIFRENLILRFFFLSLALIFLGCSNLNNPRFSEGFYEEKSLQLTRKATLIEKEKTEIVAFSTYISELDPKSFPKGEVFLVEVVFENEKIKPKDVSFLLFDKKPLKIKRISKKDEKLYRFYRHNSWSELFLVYFNSMFPVDAANVVLKMLIASRSQSLDFNYSYVVSNKL